MRFNEFNEKDRKSVSLGPAGATPGAPSMKAKIAAGGDRSNPLFSQDTLDLQKELKDKQRIIYIGARSEYTNKSI
jgi:hypothetical protein